MIDKRDRNWEFLRRLSSIVNWDKVKALNRDDCKAYYLENKDSKKNPFRSRVAMIELYPEHLVDMHFLYNLVVSGSFPYACILHDNDVYDSDREPDENGNGGHCKGEFKKEHVHVVLKFSNAKTNTAVSKQFLLNPRFVVMWDSCKEALAYLDHHQYVDKYQYDYRDIFGTLPCEVREAHQHIHDKYSAFGVLYDYIQEDGYKSMSELVRFASHQHLTECMLNHWSKFNTLIMEHNALQKMLEEKQKGNNENESRS